MSVSSPARLAFAVCALGAVGFAPAAQAATVLANVAGTVVGAVVANALVRGKTRSQCRLYDRDGQVVYLPCDGRRPVGELVDDRRHAQQYAAPPVYAAPSAYGSAYEQAAYGGASYRLDGYDGGYPYAGQNDISAWGGGAYLGSPGVAQVAGRDALGYLTWAGKPGY